MDFNDTQQKNNLINFIKSFDKEVSICYKKKHKALINNKKETIFHIKERLGDPKNNQNVIESAFGEAYLINHNDFLFIAKIIPITKKDLTKKKGEVFNEINIHRSITDDIIFNNKPPHFTTFFGYFICKDTKLEDYDNKNIIERIKFTKILSEIKRDCNKNINKLLSNKFEYSGQNDVYAQVNNNLAKVIKNIDYYFDAFQLNDFDNNIIVFSEFTKENLITFLFRYLIDKKLFTSYLDNFKQTTLINDEIKNNSLIDNKFLPSFYSIFFVYTIFFQIFTAIYTLHKNNIFHFDLHSGNIMISFDDDFFNYFDNDPYLYPKKYKKSFWNYKINSKNYFCPYFGFQIKIIDFGLSESFDNFKNKNKKEKQEFAELFIYRHQQYLTNDFLKKKINVSRNKIINMIVNGNPRFIFNNMIFCDLIMFLEGFKWELNFRLQEKIDIALRKNPNINLSIYNINFINSSVETLVNIFVNLEIDGIISNKDLSSEFLTVFERNFSFLLKSNFSSNKNNFVNETQYVI